MKMATSRRSNPPREGLIRRGECAECGSAEIVALVRDQSGRVFAVCKGCDPESWNRAAEEDKEQWLSGQDI
jgi:transcription elongation factor Elf1